MRGDAPEETTAATLAATIGKALSGA